MAQQLKIAQLDEDQVAMIVALEADTHKHIMAFEAGPEFATLSEEELERVKMLELELGVILIVYDK